MRALFTAGLIAFIALPVAAQNLPEWAYPVNPPGKPPDATKPLHLPGSNKAYTQAQIDDGFNPPDWYPEDHPPCRRWSRMAVKRPTPALARFAISPVVRAIPNPPASLVCQRATSCGRCRNLKVVPAKAPEPPR